jgi:formyl-CoA transferase
MKFEEQRNNSLRKGALEGLLVVDVSRILAGPYCSMILADYGAEVVKIEEPILGDGTRQWGPPWIGGESAYFLSINRNKSSLTLNLKTDEGQEVLRKLAAKADILIENFKPGTMERMTLDYERLSSINPGLIYCSITGYGQTGPYREQPGYDFMIQAQGGLMSLNGPPEGEPYKVGVAIVDITAGLFASSAILAALHEREHSGEGQYIDVALLDTQVGWLANVAHNYFATNQPPARFGNAHPNIVPYETFPTADGELALAIGSDKQFQRFCLIANRADIWEDERFQTNEGRVSNREDLVPILQEVFKSRPTQTWINLLVDAGIPAGPINDIPTILADPQVLAREMVQSVEHESAGSVQILGPVAKLSRTPARVQKAPPLLGADTEALLWRHLGYDKERVKNMRAAGIL